MLHIQDLSENDKLTLGNEIIVVENVVVDDSHGRTYFEYRHPHAECSICSIDRYHRLHPHAVRKWSKSGYLTALTEEAETTND